MKPGSLVATHLVDRESDLLIFTNKRLDKEFVKERVRAYRWQIENYIERDRKFLVALKPVPVEINAPLIIRRMAEAGQKANVGPMAAVAGAIAEFIGRDLIKKGYKEVIVENGGDVFLAGSQGRLVGIYAGAAKTWRNLRLKIRPALLPLGIATSSGTIGHSLSFGAADSVVIFSKDACLADSVATATCNLVKTKTDLKKAMDFAKTVKGVIGAVIILKDNLTSWGKIEFI